VRLVVRAKFTSTKTNLIQTGAPVIFYAADKFDWIPRTSRGTTGGNKGAQWYEYEYIANQYELGENLSALKHIHL
jgi:hypothetical protein